MNDPNTLGGTIIGIAIIGLLAAFIIAAFYAIIDLWTDTRRGGPVRRQERIYKRTRPRHPLQKLAPGYGCCMKCGKPWKFTKGHTTEYTEHGRGCFPLCEDCWSALTPEERLPYYRKLFDVWITQGCERDDWPAIEAAVLAGK